MSVKGSVGIKYRKYLRRLRYSKWEQGRRRIPVTGCGGIPKKQFKLFSENENIKYKENENRKRYRKSKN